MKTKVSEYKDVEIKQMIRNAIKEFKEGKTIFEHELGAVYALTLSNIFGFPIINPTLSEHNRIEKLYMEVKNE
jgi:hypothetical protein